ncbi:DUF6252 family protein [Spirosoma soli]|uniref:DUF6252 family protein n=1 Tax=Spirosoma soli TaxID=1770529 RepID=A0ABW5MCG7_9BACT
MNFSKLITSVLLIASSMACSKSDNNDTVTPSVNATMSAQINGQAFNTTSALSTFTKATKDLTVTGSDANHQVGFTLVNFSGPATVALEDRLSGKSTGSYLDVKTTTMYTIQGGRTGTVTVTRFANDVIEGTFSLKTYNSGDKKEFTVTNGQFKLPVANL